MNTTKDYTKRLHIDLMETNSLDIILDTTEALWLPDNDALALKLCLILN